VFELKAVTAAGGDLKMSRGGWIGCGLAILVILTVALGTRHTPEVAGFRTGGAGDDEWQSRLASVDRAVRRNDIDLASRLWLDAHGVALRSERWEPMLAAGQAALYIGRAAGTTDRVETEVRRCYLTALFRARDQQSVEGVLFVAEAFARMGDLEAARSALRVADTLAQSQRETGRPPRPDGGAPRW
jgi:hypothetical protein